jgi:hypothetical protein
MFPMFITTHAAVRYAERVAPDLPIHVARGELEALLADARRAATPRRWMASDRPAPGRTFLYPRSRGDVAAIAEDGVVVTVITKGMALERRFGPSRTPTRTRGPRRSRPRRTRTRGPHTEKERG